jgi:hypothetical protein
MSTCRDCQREIVGRLNPHRKYCGRRCRNRARDARKETRWIERAYQRAEAIRRQSRGRNVNEALRAI